MSLIDAAGWDAMCPDPEEHEKGKKADQKSLAELQNELTFAREHTKTMESLLNLKKAELEATNRELVKAKNQLELLREMYNDLLDRLKIQVRD